MPDRVRRKPARAEPGVSPRAPDLRCIQLRHIVAMYRVDTSARYVPAIRGPAEGRPREHDRPITGRYRRVSDHRTGSLGPADGRSGGRRSAVLELAVLGLLHETPMHGYELRKRLKALL